MATRCYCSDTSIISYFYVYLCQLWLPLPAAYLSVYLKIYSITLNFKLIKLMKIKLIAVSEETIKQLKAFFSAHRGNMGFFCCKIKKGNTSLASLLVIKFYDK